MSELPWISVADNLPPRVELVLTTDGHDYYVCAYLASCGTWHETVTGRRVNVAHWTPLPPLPSEAA